MIKDVLAVIDEAERSAPFLKAAIALAERTGAALEVAALTPAPMTSPALAPFGALYVPEVVLMGDDEANVARVREQLKNASCPTEVFGFHDDLAWLAGDVQRSRQVADLIVVGTGDTWMTPWLRRRVIATLIRSAGTPVVLMPATLPLPPIRRAVLAWKPCPEATRAMHDLVSLAEPGAIIDVVTVGTTLRECEREHDAHAEVKRHLSRHGFAVEGHWIVNDERIEADTLTLYAQEVGADVLAIGGFAHSRIRDILLGGVTRDLVERSDLPVLISR